MRLEKPIERRKKSVLKLPATLNTSVRQQLVKEDIYPKSCKKLPKNFCMLKFCLERLTKQLYLKNVTHSAARY